MADNKLDQHQIESRKEIVIPITLKGLAIGYGKLAYEAPIGLYQRALRGLDNLAIHKNMRNGYTAVLSMPLGIMLRNGARAAHNLVDSKYKYTSQWLGGTVGAGGAWWVAGKALASALSTHVPLLATVGGKIATTAIAAALSAPVVVPAFTIGAVAFATVIGAATAAISVIPAAVNLKSGLLRTLDRFKGIKGVNYDDAATEAEIMQKSLSSKYDREQYAKVTGGLRYLSEEGQKDIYEGLKAKFEKAANQTAPQAPAQAPQVAQAAAAPAATPKKP